MRNRNSRIATVIGQIGVAGTIVLSLSAVGCTKTDSVSVASHGAQSAQSSGAPKDGQKYLGATPPPGFVEAHMKLRDAAPKPGPPAAK